MDFNIDYNNIQYGWTAAIPLITAGISGLAGLFGGRVKQKQEQTQHSVTNQNQNTTSQQRQNQSYVNSSMPQYGGYEGNIKNYILGKLMNKTQESQNVDPYIAAGMKQINSGADLKQKIIQAQLAARGLSGSPMGAFGAAANESSRIGDIVNLRSSAPILQRQMQNEDMTNLMNFFKGLPVGQLSSGQSESFGSSDSNTTGQSTTDSNGTTVGSQPGAPLAGLVGGIGQGLANTFGWQWAQNQMKNGQGVQSPASSFGNPNGGNGDYVIPDYLKAILGSYGGGN